MNQQPVYYETIGLVLKRVNRDLQIPSYHVLRLVEICK